MNNFYQSLDEYLNQNILNEGDEDPVDKVLSAKEKKAFKLVFETTETGIDSMSFKKDGTIVAKRGYFYRHGASPESVAKKLETALAAQGIVIKIIETYDDWKPWPKDSNFIITFKVITL